MHATLRTMLLAMVTLSLAATSARAQARGLREVRGGPTVGVGVMLAAPAAEFGRQVGMHPGVGIALTTSGALSVRMAGTFLVYGHQYLPVSGYGYVVDVETDNIITTGGIGPQLTLGGQGPIRLYGYGMFGFAYFATVSSSAHCGCSGTYQTTYLDDWAPATEFGAGLQLRLASRRPLFLDLSARHVRTGSARYLAEGRYVFGDGSSVGGREVESVADIVIFQVGVTFALR